MQIKLSEINESQGRIVRETTAPFLIKKDGQQSVEPLKVRFFSFSTAEQEEQKAKLQSAESAGSVAYWCDILLPVIESFPEITDDDSGLPVPITREFLARINGVNLQSIYNAIRDAPLPKLQGAK